MTSAVETVQVAAVVPKDLADELRDLARASERSTAAEIRLAIKAWVDSHQEPA
jgi:hypothetical protein